MDKIKVQAIIFDRNKWTLNTAKKWFESHGFKLPYGKLVHLTDKYIRYRNMMPNYKKYFHRIKNVGNGIKIIFAILK